MPQKHPTTHHPVFSNMQYVHIHPHISGVGRHLQVLRGLVGFGIYSVLLRGSVLIIEKLMDQKSGHMGPAPNLLVITCRILGKSLPRSELPFPIGQLKVLDQMILKVPSSSKTQRFLTVMRGKQGLGRREPN